MRNVVPYDERQRMTPNGPGRAGGEIIVPSATRALLVRVGRAACRSNCPPVDNGADFGTTIAISSIAGGFDPSF